MKLTIKRKRLTEIKQHLVFENKYGKMGIKRTEYGSYFPLGEFKNGETGINEGFDTQREAYEFLEYKLNNNEIYEKGEHRVILAEKGNTHNTFKATIYFKECATAQEVKESMFEEFGIDGNIDDFRISITRLREAE